MDVIDEFICLMPSNRKNVCSNYWFDIQLFAADDEGRTEDPTGKRISKAREEGQVAKSIEINQSLELLVAGMVFVFILPRIIGQEMNYVKYYLSHLSELELTIESFRAMMLNIGIHILAVIWPLLLAEIVVAIGANLAQSGWLFTWKPLQPKWNKIFPNPKKLVDRLLIGKTMLFNLTKSIFKITFISWISYGVIVNYLPAMISMWQMQPYVILNLIVSISWELIWKICLFLLLIASADYGFNRYQWKDSLKMKKEEVKDEAKQAEGDPIIKRAQRQKMIQVARRRMMREIPTADVVITNPTHYAIALKYDQSVMTAPRCIGKGEGFIALKIRQIAEEHGVPIVENKPLAQALFRGVEIGEEVPPQFYSAVAEVLAYVYRTKKQAV